jgi:hypothetical protein
MGPGNRFADRLSIVFSPTAAPLQLLSPNRFLASQSENRCRLHLPIGQIVFPLSTFEYL